MPDAPMEATCKMSVRCRTRPLVRWSEAAALAEATDILAHFPAPAGTDLGHSLAGRLRGALGHALMGSAEARLSSMSRTRRRIYNQPSAFEQLFSESGSSLRGVSPAAQIPPYTLSTDVSRGSVTVRLRLFGRAGFHLPEVAEALRAGLTRGGVSISPRARSRFRVADRDLSVETEAARPARSPVVGRPTVRMVTISPLFIGRGRAVSIDAAAIVGSGLMRAAGMLAWCGITLQLDEGAVAHARRSARLADASLRIGESWQRYSSRQNAVQTYFGFAGGLSLSGLDDEFTTLLPLIEMAGLGQRTTIGFGRVLFFVEA